MKRVFIIIILAMSTLFAMAQGRIDLRSESKAEITRSDLSMLQATFSFGSIESQAVETEKGVFSEISLDGTYIAGEAGSPMLPAAHQLLAVPFGAQPVVNIVNYTMKEYKLDDYGINTLMPRQPSVKKNVRPEDVKFIYNASAYAAKGFDNKPLATIEVEGTMRGIQVGSLLINPLKYDVSTNTLRVYNNIEVEVDFVGGDIAGTRDMLLKTYSPYFDIVYKQFFNSRDILDVYTDHPDLMAYPVNMIVIAPQNYLSALEPWTNWKIQKGFNVDVYTTAQSGSTYSAIRTFIQNKYNAGVSAGKTPTFLILVGDTGQIPASMTASQTSNGKVSDLKYGTMDSDYFPEMFYSRMSAENTSQLTSIINKILQVEQYTIPDPSYLNKVLLIAGADSYWNPRVGQPTINYATNNYYNTSHGFTNVYKYLSSYTNCYNNFNTGVGFANYTAHGDNTMWADPQFTNSNVNNLTNANKYFLAMGNCCLSGNFGYSSACFGEAMIRATNKGAYSYIGSCPETTWYEDYYFGVGANNTFSNTPTYANSQTGVYDGVWMDDTYNTVSSMVFLGNIAVTYAYTGSYQNSGISPLYYWQAYHVLGDGSIMPYRVQPTANSVSHASTINAGATTFQVNAQSGSYVGISQDNVLLGAAYVSSTSVNVSITPVTSGEVKIVVTKPQRQPYIATITVNQGAVAPTVTTSAVTNITRTSATGGGNVTADGNAAVTARGICWSTSHNPTVSDNHAASGTGTGSFTVNMTGLTAGTTYYVRAYATNSEGTAYGSEVSFTTENGLVGDADLNGQVNINDVLAIMRHALQIQALDGQGLELADVNGNGTVDMNDAVILLRTVLGIGK